MAEADGNATPESVRSDPTSVAASRPRPQEGWRPIESYSRETHPSVLVAGPDGVGEAMWHEDEGWWWMNNDPCDAWGTRIYPTHWQPLPDPPGVAASPPPQEPALVAELVAALEPLLDNAAGYDASNVRAAFARHKMFNELMAAEERARIAWKALRAASPPQMAASPKTSQISTCRHCGKYIVYGHVCAPPLSDREKP